MKIKGRKIEGPNVEVIIIPRGDGVDDIIFKAQAILDMDPFYAACPEPKPPAVILKGGTVSENREDPMYKQSLLEFGQRRIAWMVLKSLEATEELVWEKAKIEDVNTWLFFKSELIESGFSDIEIGRIINGVMAANCLDESKLEQARARFALSQAALADASSSQTVAPVFTPSGGPANASA